MSESNKQLFLIKWAFILFLITTLTSIFFFKNKYFLIGLCIGTLITTTKFVFNSYYFNKLLKSEIKNSVIFGMINIFITLFVIFVICFIMNSFKLINIYFISGLIIGLSYIIIVIFITSILQSLYIIRNKI